jgi:hypothetical protein
VAVTLPAQSPPDAQEPDEAPSDRSVPSPAAFIAVVAVSALVIILCVLGAFLSGLFGTLTSPEDTSAQVPVASPIPPTASAALTSFDDGQWLVGTEIQAGAYETTVPAGSAGCTWERNDSTDGTAQSVLESGVGREGDVLVVDIRATDTVFQSQGCGLWQRRTD